MPWRNSRMAAARCRWKVVMDRVARDPIGDRPSRNRNAVFSRDTTRGLFLRVAEVVEAQCSCDDARGIFDAFKSCEGRKVPAAVLAQQIWICRKLFLRKPRLTIRRPSQTGQKSGLDWIVGPRGARLFNKRASGSVYAAGWDRRSDEFRHPVNDEKR